MAESGRANVTDSVGTWQRIQTSSSAGDQEVPPPRWLAASCVVGDELFVFGGRGRGDRDLDDLWKYNFKANVWEEVQVLSDIKPDKRFGAAFAVCDSSLAIYLFGGKQKVDGVAKYLNDLWKFDIQSKHWTLIHDETDEDGSVEADQESHGPIPSKRSRYVCTIHNGKFILFGGNGAGKVLNDLNVFDIETSTWSEVQAQEGVWPSPRWSAAWTKDIGYLYIHGGRKGSNVKSDLFALDLETLKWKEMESVGIPPRFHSHSICWHENSIYLYGGCLSAKSPLTYSAGLYVYHIESSQCTKEDCSSTNAPKARAASVAHVHKNSIYLFGGFDGSVQLDDFYRYLLNPISVPPATIGCDMQSLVNNPQLADVCFMVEGNKVHAHKNILVTRSEYFHTMLMGGMRESSSDKKAIEISGVSHATFLKVLEFLYSDECPCGALDEVKELLVASDMFQLDRLKALCENSIRRRMSNETVCSILLVSHRLQATGLKECAMDYLMENWKDPVVKQHRSELQNEADLMFEILQREDLNST